MNNILWMSGLVLGICGALRCLYVGILSNLENNDSHKELMVSVIVGYVGVVLIYISLLV